MLWTTLNVSAHSCTRSVGWSRKAAPRLQGPSPFWLNSASASQCLTVWRHDQKFLRVISVSDAGGIGGPPTENCGNVQNAHLILVADSEIRHGLHTKASPLNVAIRTVQAGCQLHACGRNNYVCSARRCRVGTDHDSPHSGGPRDSQGNAQDSGLSHSMDPTPTEKTQ